MKTYKVTSGSHVSRHDTACAAIAAAGRLVYMGPETQERAALALAAGQPFDYCYGFVGAGIERETPEDHARKTYTAIVRRELVELGVDRYDATRAAEDLWRSTWRGVPRADARKWRDGWVAARAGFPS